MSIGSLHKISLFYKTHSCHFIRQPWVSKTFPIRQPFETSKFTPKMLLLGCFGYSDRRSITTANLQRIKIFNAAIRKGLTEPKIFGFLVDYWMFKKPLILPKRSYSLPFFCGIRCALTLWMRIVFCSGISSFCIGSPIIDSP